MKPPIKKFDYEKVKTDDFVVGRIKEIKYDLQRKSVFKGVEKIGPACKIVFSIEGCQYPHASHWMSFNLDEKSNLFKKYVSSLVEGAYEYMDLDLDQLIGMEVKMLWKDDGEYQKIEVIRPLKDKLVPDPNFKMEQIEHAEEVSDETVPF